MFLFPATVWCTSLSEIGDYALMRGLSGTSRDVPPFAIIDWQHTVRGVNVVGLKRAGFDEQRIRAIRQAFRTLFRSGRNLALAVKEVKRAGGPTPMCWPSWSY